MQIWAIALRNRMESTALEEDMADWITAIASLIAAAGIGFVAFQAKIAAEQLRLSAEQLRLSKMALEADHERGRILYAIQVVRQWTDSLDMAQPSARGVVEEMSRDQCISLRKREAMKVPESMRKRLEHVLKDVINSTSELDSKNGEISLDQKHIAHIYFLVVRHLNSLEVALMPWMYGVADRQIIESELRYLVRPDTGQYVLQTLREVLGENSFPAIKKFADHLRTKYQEEQPSVRSHVA